MEQRRAEFLAAAGELYDEVSRWRQEHPEASFDEIVAQVRPKRRVLMGELLTLLALQAGSGAVAEGTSVSNVRDDAVQRATARPGGAWRRGQSAQTCALLLCPVKLSQQSYRAGLWDAATFANQQWAESERRGLPRSRSPRRRRRRGDLDLADCAVCSVSPRRSLCNCFTCISE
jgi:hypothetical protein